MALDCYAVSMQANPRVNVETKLSFAGGGAGSGEDAAMLPLRPGSKCGQYEENRAHLACFAPLCAFHALGAHWVLSTPIVISAVILIVLLAVITLGLTIKFARTTRQLHQLRQQVEELVQARIAHLQAANVQLAAELTACQQTAAAVADEYAHLLEQAREMAAAEERARLARDLHDSVTQTIYSASLIAQVLPSVWQRNPSEGERNLGILRQLVRGALAEMRTLLFELRPAALEAANLGVLLQQLGDVLTGHKRIPVTITITGEADLPTALKIAVYRIAQEAFNNIAKHAGATQVEATLWLTPGEGNLLIADNGRGFDQTQVPGERMGVRIMAERAAGIAASFHIESAPGQGTTVSLQWTGASVASSEQSVRNTDN